jgi:DNA repair ATPase RecN
MGQPRNTFKRYMRRMFGKGWKYEAYDSSNLLSLYDRGRKFEKERNAKYCYQLGISIGKLNGEVETLKQANQFKHQEIEKAERDLSVANSYKKKYKELAEDYMRQIDDLRKELKTYEKPSWFQMGMKYWGGKKDD